MMVFLVCSINLHYQKKSTEFLEVEDSTFDSSNIKQAVLK